MACLYLSHADCALHDMGERHPESPARLAAVERGLREAGLWTRLAHEAAPMVSRAALLRVHEARYLDGLVAALPARGTVRLDPDTALSPRSLDAAGRAAGAVVAAVDAVMAGRARSAFCGVRPPGHHARRAQAMGFCLYNSVAVGVAQALARHGVERVAVIDFDLHRGNGTEEIFREDARVLMADSFQHPFYPHTQAVTPRAGYLPLPMPAGTAGPAWRAAWARDALPRLREFRPQLVFFSAGFDAHRDDPLGQLQLEEADYAWLTHEVRDIAEAFAGGRMVSALEGGYQLDALGRSVAAHVAALGDC